MKSISDDDRCELDPNKVCDNCFRCLEPAAGQDYAKIEIAAVYTSEDYLIEAAEADDVCSPALPKVHAHTLTGLHAEKRRI